MAGKFINLEQIVRDWAWQQYDKTATTSRQQKLRQKDKKEPQRFLSLEIDWSETKFVDETLWSPLRPDDAQDENSTNLVAATQKNKLPSSSDLRGSVLFQTSFTNNTNGVQEYTMKTEKKTKTTLTTEIEQGYTRGTEMSIKLAAPGEIFEANAGYHREFSLSRIEGETFEEELTWGVESLIRVNEGYVAEASLVVEERKQRGNFTIRSKIRGPVYVTFTAPSDNNSFVKSLSHDIVQVIEDFLAVEQRKGKQLNFVRVETDSNGLRTAIVETTGFCRFRYGVKQDIRVDQKPLNSH